MINIEKSNAECMVKVIDNRFLEEKQYDYRMCKLLIVKFLGIRVYKQTKTVSYED